MPPYRNIPVKKSYGILCCRYDIDSKQIELLMIKRRCSYYYNDFVMGHYNRNDEARLIALFNNMSAEEKVTISRLNFSQMWYRVWFDIPDRNARDKVAQEHYIRFMRCKEIFEKNFMNDHGDYLRILLNRSHSCETPWEIPKGRKADPKEKDLNAAIREVWEETGLNPDEYVLLGEQPLVNTYIYDNTKYVNTFYIALLKPECRRELRIDYSNNQQVAEAIDIRYIPLNELGTLDVNKRLQTLTWNLSRILRKTYKIHKIYTLGLVA